MGGHPIGSFEPDAAARRTSEKASRTLAPLAGPYVPNEVPGLTRFFLGCAAITWTAWALVGLLSGHMFLLISRGGPIHFFGLGAVLFSAAVLLAVVLCLLPIVDHFDPTDLRPRIAWLYSMLVACMGMRLLILGATARGVVRGLRSRLGVPR